MSSILYATDLSAAADMALPFALEISRRNGSRMYAVHVIQEGAYSAGPTFGLLEAAEGEAPQQSAKRDLEERLKPVPHEVIFRRGRIWETLSAVIKEKSIDLLVLGIRGQTESGKAILGAHAEEVFRNAACPVVTTGPGAASKSAQFTGFKRVLYATDFSPESLAGAPHAISLARKHDAQLVLLHCLEGEGDATALQQTLREVVPLGSDLRSEPDCIVERGKPAEKIPAVAADQKADIVVLGVRGEDGYLARIPRFSHSGIFRIITQADCPVMTVRA